MIHCTFSLTTGLSSRLSTRGNAASACVRGLKVGEALSWGVNVTMGLILGCSYQLRETSSTFLKKTLYLDTTFPGWSRPMEFPFPFDISPASILDFSETNISTALHNI